MRVSCVALTFGVAALLCAPRVFAFCRTTTCDVTANKLPPSCLPEERDANDCSLKGAKLFWPSQCVSFGIQENGSKKLGISWETTDAIVRKAFVKWSTVDCGAGRRPSLKIYDLDDPTQPSGAPNPVICSEIEFNESAPNASVWLYRDDAWPYHNAANALALTTITFDETGRILDADVELNSFSKNLTTSDTDVGSDLESIVTHETGHFLGLGHETLVPGATMNTFYQQGTTDFRTLESDDITGICAIYPPDRNAPDCKDRPTPLHGFTRYCEQNTATARSGLSLDSGSGCTCSFDKAGGRAPIAVTWSTLFLLALRARRRRTNGRGRSV